MNAAELHLVVNHIPVIGVPACFLLLAAALWKKSRDLAWAGFAGLVLCALFTFAAHKTGHAAAHFIRAIPGIQGEAIHEHDEAADWAIWFTDVLGVMGLAGLWLGRRQEGAPKALIIAATVVALFATVVFMRVAHLGGLIRHPEISSDFQPQELPHSLSVILQAAPPAPAQGK